MDKKLVPLRKMSLKNVTVRRQLPVPTPVTFPRHALVSPLTKVPFPPINLHPTHNIPLQNNTTCPTLEKP